MSTMRWALILLLDNLSTCSIIKQAYHGDPCTLSPVSARPSVHVYNKLEHEVSQSKSGPYKPNFHQLNSIDGNFGLKKHVI